MLHGMNTTGTNFIPVDGYAQIGDIIVGRRHMSMVVQTGSLPVLLINGYKVSIAQPKQFQIRIAMPFLFLNVSKNGKNNDKN